MLCMETRRERSDPSRNFPAQKGKITERWRYDGLLVYATFNISLTDTVGESRADWENAQIATLESSSHGSFLACFYITLVFSGMLMFPSMQHTDATYIHSE